MICAREKIPTPQATQSSRGLCRCSTPRHSHVPPKAMPMRSRYKIKEVRSFAAVWKITPHTATVTAASAGISRGIFRGSCHKPRTAVNTAPTASHISGCQPPESQKAMYPPAAPSAASSDDQPPLPQITPRGSGSSFPARLAALRKKPDNTYPPPRSRVCTAGSSSHLRSRF